MRKWSGFGWVELLIGILLTALGIGTFVYPGAALTGAVVIYGVLAVLMGIVDIVIYVKLERFTGFGPMISLISGILSVMAGALVIAHPSAGRWAVAVLFPIWFLAHCISRLANLSPIQRLVSPVSYYLTMILNILGLVLGILLIFRPYAAMLSVDMFIGGYLVLLGLDSIVLAFSKAGRDW